MREPFSPPSGRKPVRAKHIRVTFEIPSSPSGDQSVALAKAFVGLMQAGYEGWLIEYPDGSTASEEQIPLFALARPKNH